jgi:GNAT superfamily N-acetyltransferase
MAIDLIRATPEHADAVARIFFDAFEDIATRHGFASDIYSREMAAGAGIAFCSRPDMYGIVAIEDKQVVGFNFVQLTDAVAGVGPICVDPKRQSKGLGRRLMQHIVDYSLANHGPQVRLYQEGFNMISLSLYTAIGFDVTEPVVLMSVPPTTDPTVRPLTPADIEAADALCLATQKVSRRNELGMMIQVGPGMGVVPHGRFAGDKLTAFVVPGFFGFGSGESADDLITTARVAIAGLPQPLQKMFLPTRNGLLYRTALQHGFRALKVGQLMAIGPFEQPTGFWAPSVAY